jgi:hypothetical protein
MAREIGAKNGFEVIRLHQTIKSGIDQLAVSSEHFHIASCSSKADIYWMYSLPVSSNQLGALFVYAPFLSGICLAKQILRLISSFL